MDQEFISVAEAAQVLGVSRWALYSWAIRGELPSFKFGRCRRFKKSEVLAWAEKRRNGGQK